jgi:hypothetical protein
MERVFGIAMGGQTQGTFGQGDKGDRFSQHIEKFDTIPRF